MPTITAEDVRGVLARVSGLDSERLSHLLGTNRRSGADWAGEAAEALNKRLGGMPLAYALGGMTFMGRWMKSDRRACAVRPYTEAFVRSALERRNSAPMRVLEIGCGAGAIIISLALTIRDGLFIGADIDPGALSLAQENAAVYDVPVTFLQTDLFEGIEGRFDVIVANLPYERASTSDEAAESEHEPRIAIFDPGAEEFGIQKRCLRDAMSRLRPQGRLYVDLPNTLETERLFRGRPVRWELGGEPVGREMTASHIAETLQIMESTSMANRRES